MNSSITTHSNRVFDYLNPTEIHLNDIAVGLKRENRFANQSRRAYSVLSHIMSGYGFFESAKSDTGYHISKMINSNKDPLNLQLGWLLHDASEAYMRDIPTPLKNLCPCYKEIEDKVQSAIYKKFDVSVSEEDHNTIKAIDSLLVEFEKYALFPALNIVKPLTPSNFYIYRSANPQVFCRLVKQILKQRLA